MSFLLQVNDEAGTQNFVLTFPDPGSKQCTITATPPNDQYTYTLQLDKDTSEIVALRRPPGNEDDYMYFIYIPLIRIES